MEFKVLGPLLVSAAGQPVVVSTARKRRLVLAVLLARAGQPVPVDTLVEAVWGQRPPASARRNLQLYVHELRRSLGNGLITTRGDGYLIDPGSELDSVRFRGQAADGAAALDAGDPAAAEATLRAALDLWRGSAFDEFLDCRLVADEAQWLELLRLECCERWAEAQLATGPTPRLAAELTRLSRLHPYRETLRAQLMRALYRTGRQAEALSVFREVRELLAEQLGVEPGSELQRLHQAILRGEETPVPAARTEAPRELPPDSGGVVPRELPAAVAGFVGRADALGQLDALAHDRTVEAPAPVSIALIAGQPGVGKTSLVVHWAHRVAHAFPHGQLYVDLRGFGPAGAPVEPAQAMRRLLDALHVPPAAIPTNLDSQAGTYRSRLAGRRMLVVLDNAHDAEQVRPLLPGTPGCLVVVTSRNQLPGLVASHAARLIQLAPFTDAEARELLAQRLGADRVAAEPQATAEIVTRCARLPVALTVAAARAATTPELPLEATAAQLRGAGETLDALAGADPVTDVRAVFSWSYRALTPPVARLFRLLGLTPIPEITATAAASLAGVPVLAVQASLTELAQAHLVSEPSPNRYAMHDLLRSYAAELSAAVEAEADRRDASHRLLDHYLHTGHVAHQLLYPHQNPATLAPPHPGATPQLLADRAAAVDWFTTEHQVLLAAIFQAGAAGFDDHTWQLAAILWGFLNPRRYLHDQLRSETAALAAAQRMADQPRQILVHCVLARVYAKLERYPDAYTQADYADQLADQLSEPAEHARAWLARAFVADLQGHPARALREAQKAHDRLRAAGLPRARTLQAMGDYHLRLADHAQALACWRAAVALHHQAGNRLEEAETWDRLGSAHRQLDDYRQATACYLRAIRGYRHLGRSYEQARTLQQLGELQQAAGGPTAAVRAWRSALTILDQLDHPDADQLRTLMNHTCTTRSTEDVAS